jgi:hypothetical protein
MLPGHQCWVGCKPWWTIVRFRGMILLHLILERTGTLSASIPPIWPWHFLSACTYQGQIGAVTTHASINSYLVPPSSRVRHLITLIWILKGQASTSVHHIKNWNRQIITIFPRIRKDVRPSNNPLSLWCMGRRGKVVQPLFDLDGQRGQSWMTPLHLLLNIQFVHKHVCMKRNLSVEFNWRPPIAS